MSATGNTKHPLGIEAFHQVLQEVLDQVTVGKGHQRHGLGKKFESQAWTLIAENVGPDFLLGQAMKKLLELQSHDPLLSCTDNLEARNICQKKWDTDALGSIVYIAMYVLFKRREHAQWIDQRYGKKKTKEQDANDSTQQETD